jgi:hypothetical protein
MKTMLASDGEQITCIVCNNSGIGDPRDWHHWRHSFKGGKGPVSPPQSPVPPSPGTPMTAGPAFDPVLRLALVNKGLITVQDLQDAQTEMYAITGNIPQLIGEIVGGESSDVPGRSAVDG